MAMIDDIMQQLQGMGLNIGGGFGSIGGFDPSQISQALQGQYGLTSQQLPSSLFRPISEGLLKGGLASTYSPQVESTGQTLIDKMLTQTQGQAGKQAFGGFSGSGQQQRFAGQAKDVYGKGMTDILSQTGRQRSQSLQGIQDMINQWQSQALQVKGYQ